MIVGTVETDKSMVAMTAMSKADLAIIELDFGGELAGLSSGTVPGVWRTAGR